MLIGIVIVILASLLSSILLYMGSKDEGLEAIALWGAPKYSYASIFLLIMSSIGIIVSSINNTS